MKFDCVIGNPPYQDPNNKRSPLWQKFVKKSFELVKDGGFLSLIHPCSWRKPSHKLFELFKNNNLKYLKIYDQKEGMKIFNAGTRFDWYVVKKEEYKGSTVIIDEEGKEEVYNISGMGFIPHKEIDWFISLLAKDGEEKCELLYNTHCHAQRKDLVNTKNNEEFQYPCVHATRVKKIVFRYAKHNDTNFFGISKVIMGDASPENGFYDKEGKYGTTEHAFSIKMKTDKDGKDFEKALKSKSFKKLASLCKWSGFQTQYYVFENLKYGFWKEFV